MHLDTLKIQRFRSCADVTVQFRKDMTVLVGENNGGKSNIVDAIRLLTLPLSGRRERYAEDEDLRRGSPDPSFTIEGAFRGLSDTLKGLLISAVPGRPVAILLDRQVISVATVKSPVGDSAVLTGIFSEDDARRIAAGLTRTSPPPRVPGVAQSVVPQGDASIAGVGSSLSRHRVRHRFLPRAPRRPRTAKGPASRGRSWSAR